MTYKIILLFTYLNPVLNSQYSLLATLTIQQKSSNEIARGLYRTEGFENDDHGSLIKLTAACLTQRLFGCLFLYSHESLTSECAPGLAGFADVGPGYAHLDCRGVYKRDNN